MKANLRKYVIAILIFCAAFSGCGKKEKTKSQEPQAVPVTIAKVKMGAIAETPRFVATIKAEDEALVYPRASGKVKDKLKDVGDFVEKGEVIMNIDRDEVGYEYAPSPVDAPIGGLIGRVYVDKGDSVTEKTALASVVNIKTVKVKADLPEKVMPSVKIGQVVYIRPDAYPGEVFESKLSKVSPQVEDATRTFSIEAQLDNKDLLLKPGMFARLEIEIRKEESALLIPRECAIRGVNEVFTYVVKDGAAQKRQLSLGIEKLDEVEVVSGVGEGEAVVVKGQHRLKDGMRIMVVEER